MSNKIEQTAIDAEEIQAELVHYWNSLPDLKKFFLAGCEDKRMHPFIDEIVNELKKLRERQEERALVDVIRTNEAWEKDQTDDEQGTLNLSEVDFEADDALVSEWKSAREQWENTAFMEKDRGISQDEVNEAKQEAQDRLQLATNEMLACKLNLT